MAILPKTQAVYDNIKIKHERGKSAKWQNLYNHRWRKYSKSRLIKHHLCVECDRQGKTEIATETDHIIPHKGSRHKFWDKSNHQSLCKSCHSKKTISEGAFGK